MRRITIIEPKSVRLEKGTGDTSNLELIDDDGSKFTVELSPHQLVRLGEAIVRRVDEWKAVGT